MNAVCKSVSNSTTLTLDNNALNKWIPIPPNNLLVQVFNRETLGSGHDIEVTPIFGITG